MKSRRSIHTTMKQTDGATVMYPVCQPPDTVITVADYVIARRLSTTNMVKDSVAENAWKSLKMKFIKTIRDKAWSKYLTAVEDCHTGSLDPYKEICRVYDLLNKQDNLTDSELELKRRLGSFINRTTWRNLFRQGII